MIEPRFLVLRRWNGETHSAIEYADFARTRDQIARGEARRIPMTPVQAIRAANRLCVLAQRRG